MDRRLHDCMIAQYGTPEVSGDGLVSWVGGVKCVMPSVRLYGAAVQETLTGKNLFDADWVVAQYEANNYESVGGYRVVAIPMDNGTYTIKVNTPVSHIGFAIISTNKAVNTQYDTAVSLMQQHWANQRTLNIKNGVLYIGEYGVNKLAECVRDAHVQIELGSTATDYEPYCGGIPAPNPQYPIMPVCNDGVYQLTNADGTWDGGQATAPELWAIPGTDIRDEWDAQTGCGVRRCATIESYAGEEIATPYISSTGELSEGATVLYGIPDTPFYHPPAKLTQPPGYGQIIQVSGSVPDCPITAKYLTHAGGAK